MLLTNFENIHREFFNSIDNPSLEKEDIQHIIDSDYSLTYSPTFFCIVNRLDFAVNYISKNMHACLGISESELKANGLKYLWSRIHKKDLECLCASLNELLVHTKALPHRDTEQYSYSWNYRLKTKRGKYLNIIQNTTPFVLKETSVKKGLTHFTVLNSHFKMPISATINALSNNYNYTVKHTTNCSQKSFFKDISNREKDIIKLLTQERTSKSIGKRLCISSKTVDTHRRNILKKLKLSSTGELINILKSQEQLV